MGSLSDNIVLNTTGAVPYASVNHSGIILASSTHSVLNVDGSSSTSAVPKQIQAYQPWAQVLMSVALGIMIIGTIVGNSLVCIAVAIVKRLQTPSNLLIVSLALSDLLVAVLVMPLSAMYEVLQYWPLDDTVCDLWTSLDVIMCTSSILNLCMISVDRYFVITRPFKYAIRRTPRRMGIMIAGVWLSSGLISIPPLFGWKTPNPPHQCLISQELGYQIYATLGAFYIPLTAMIVVYFRIWIISSRIARKERHSKVGSIDKGTEHFNLSTKSSRSSGASDHLHIPNGSLKNGLNEADDASTEMLSKKLTVPKRRFTLKSLISRTSKSSVSNSSHERKATKTLGVIMGGFTLCWLPFFILAVIRPLVDPNDIPQWLISLLMWLGYFNSFLNPVIYARFNRDFRTPFKEILCLRCRGINVRLRSESYAEQYGPDRIDRGDRDSLRPRHDSVIRYNSHGQTVVHIGNGNSKYVGESKI